MIPIASNAGSSIRLRDGGVAIDLCPPLLRGWHW